MLIVLDRSCSMKGVPVGDSKTKWELALGAINKLITDLKGKLRFGLTLFPDQTGSDCEQDQIPIPTGDDNEAAIAALLAASDYSGPCVTNIHTAMSQAATDPGFKDTTRRSFVLLITDGQQVCTTGSDADTEQTITQMFSGLILTYVVGFGSAVDPTALNAFAKAGGTAKSGTPSYYQANNSAELDSVLAAIGEQVDIDEFGGCPGVPCPDGRCAVSGQVCVNGFCGKPIPDGGALGLDGGGGPGDGSVGDGSGGGDGLSRVREGCDCGVSGGMPASIGLALVLLLLWLALGRGIRRPGAQRLRRVTRL
jgi:hypothetical protein